MTKHSGKKLLSQAPKTGQELTQGFMPNVLAIRQGQWKVGAVIATHFNT